RRGALLPRELRTVQHDVPQRLDRRDPELSRWGEGRLSIEWSAVAVSVVLHGMLLLTLAMVGYAANSEGRRVLQGRIVDTTLPDLERAGFQDLDQGDERPAQQPVAGSSSPNVSTVAITVPATSGTSAAAADLAPSHAPAPTELATIDVRRATEAAVPTAGMLGQSVSIKGNAPSTSAASRGRRPHRRRDPPPAGEGAHPGHLGVRRLGEPPRRTPAAEQAHRDDLRAHQAARREGAGER
ncbi:MAG: hypothetical protein WKF75_10980, partial [Singulisphaera sp.]